MDRWFTYMIECSDGSIYTGVTTDVTRRMKQHNAGTGAKYTRKRHPIVLKALWQGKGRSESSKLEYAIKKLTRKKKLELIEGDEIITISMDRKLIPDPRDIERELEHNYQTSYSKQF